MLNCSYFQTFLLCALPVLPQTSALDREFTISADVELVILDVSVKDPKGGFVSGLVKDNFRVYENKKEQSIKYFSHADIPVTVGLVIDNSGSMRPKRAEVITAALTFVHASNPRDEMFVVTFNDKVRRGLPEDALFTDNAEMLRTALWKGASEGRTAMYDALGYSLKYLDKGRMDKKTLILVSDGGDNASSVGKGEVMRQVLESRATIYTIGIFDEDDPDRNPDILQKLAQVSGGEYFQLRTLDEVVPVCRKIAADIRNRYTVAYIPSRPDAPQSARLLKVTASSPSHPRLIVHTRKQLYPVEADRTKAPY